MYIYIIYKYMYKYMYMCLLYPLAIWNMSIKNLSLQHIVVASL